MPEQSKPGPDTISPERAPSLGVALRFFLTGLAFLAALLALTVYRAPLIVQEYLHNPATLAITHLFTLGFGGSVVLGAVYQIVPVMLYSHLHSERLATWHLGSHAIGTAVMVVGFYRAAAPWVATGGSLVLTGALLFAYNLLHTFRRAERWNAHGWPMAAALVYFLSTLLWGVVLVLNQWYGFLGEVEGAPLNAHLALGLGGFFGLMLLGVGLKLLPMFAPGRSLPAAFVAGTAGAMALGVPSLIAGLWTAPALRWTGALLIAAALLSYAGAVTYTYIHRRAGPLDFSVRFSLTSVPLIALCALALPVALAAAPGASAFGYRPAAPALLLLYALGVVGSTMLGMLLRIIPFSVWLHRFRSRTQKVEKIPFLHEMFHPRLGWAAYLSWFAAVALMAGGMAAQSGPVLATGGALGLAGLGAYAAALAQILRHVPRGVAPLYPGRK